MRLVVRVLAALVLLGAIPAWMAFEGIPPRRLFERWFWGNVAESLATLGPAGPAWTLPVAAAFLGVTLAVIVAFLIRRRARRSADEAGGTTPAQAARRVGIANHLAARGEPAVAIARQTGFARDAVRSISRRGQEA